MAPTDPVELQKWTLSDSMANNAIELRCSLNIRDLIAATSTATWTALSDSFGPTGVSRLFGDFKAVTQFCFSGMQHPAAEISHFNTHNQRLVASGVTLSGYILGMLLLGALPSKWDHFATIHLQGKTVHTAIDYTEVQNAIIAEYERTGTVIGQQQHVHKISAVKRKGEHPSFSHKRSYSNAPKAQGEGQVSSSKKKPKTKSKGKGKAHFVEHEPAPIPFSAASAVRPMIALQPSRAAPNTTTIASINRNRVTYSTVATPKTAQTFTGVSRKVGPNTLQTERGLLQRMNVTPTIQTLETMSLEDRLKYPKPLTMAPEAISLADQIYESNRASHSTQESGPSIS